VLDRINGSHHVFVKSGVHVTVVGPANNEVSIGVLKQVQRKMKEVQ
jgi:predicted RNA binding protein YcfA (HicA-like mRNA interferase family)